MLNMDNFLKELDYALDVLHNHANSSSKDEELSADEKKQSRSCSTECLHSNRVVTQQCPQPEYVPHQR